MRLITLSKLKIFLYTRSRGLTEEPNHRKQWVHLFNDKRHLKAVQISFHFGNVFASFCKVSVVVGVAGDMHSSYVYYVLYSGW